MREPPQKPLRNSPNSLKFLFFPAQNSPLLLPGLKMAALSRPPNPRNPAHYANYMQTRPFQPRPIPCMVRKGRAYVNENDITLRHQSAPRGGAASLRLRSIPPALSDWLSLSSLWRPSLPERLLPSLWPPSTRSALLSSRRAFSGPLTPAVLPKLRAHQSARPELTGAILSAATLSPPKRPERHRKWRA